MAPSFLIASRTVLIIGDESLCAYTVTGTTVTYMDSLTWDMPDFENRLARLIANDGRGRPVLLVNDTTDQHFKGGQRIPKVGVLDRQNVLNRKLQVAFPNYPIRAALELKLSRKQSEQNADADGPPGSGSLFIFAGIPLSENINRTVTATKRSLASVSGFLLLPVDGSDMVARLSSKVGGEEHSPSQWVVFIGQHRSGGLRQVVIRNGQLAMTRMTPMPENTFGTSEWADNVNQEIRATVSYLSRFGYASEDGMDLLVIADPQAGEELKAQIDISCNFVSFTVNEAASLLGMGLGQQDEQFADVLYAAWLSRKRSYLMPVKIPQLSNISRARQYAAVVMVLLGCAALYQSYQMVSAFAGMHTASEDVDTQKTALVKAQKDKNEVDARMKAIGFDVKKLEAASESYDKFKQENVDALPVLQKIGQALGQELRLSSLKVAATTDAGTGAGTAVVAPPASGDAVKKPMNAILVTMTMTFPSTLEPKVGVDQVNQFSDRLKEKFPAPHYTVDVTRQVADLTYTSATSGKAGDDLGKADAKQDYSAEIQLKETGL